MRCTAFAVIVAATRLLAQSNPAGEALAEQLRTQPLKGMQKITVMARNLHMIRRWSSNAWWRGSVRPAYPHFGAREKLPYFARQK
jgi:hypothetical protein